MGIRKVLVVDDEPDIRRVIALSLAHFAGWEVVQAASGPEALALAVAERPDVVLLDVTMPGMDGRQTLAALRADPSTATIPVVFATARVRPNDVEEWIALGARGHLTKPFDPTTIAAEIARIVGAV